MQYLKLDKLIEVFYDGDCPLCSKEINFLRRLDSDNKIQFTDIADPYFNLSIINKTMNELMDHIHGRLPDGSIIEGVEVFRQLYGAVGFGPLVAVSRLPGISHILDLCYHIFAKNRLKWTGRCHPDGTCKVNKIK